MALSNYLFPRGKRGTWQLRVAVPSAYRRSRGGSGERVCSLRTTDRILAEKRALPILAEWQAEWDQPQTVRVREAEFDESSPVDVAVKVAHDQFLRDLEAGRKASSLAGTYQAFVEQRERDHQLFVEEFLQGNLARWEAVANRAIQFRALAIEPASEAYVAFVDQLAQSGLDALDVFNRRTRGEVDAEPRSRLVRHVRNNADRKATPGETILELYDLYKQWRCQPGRKRRRRPASMEQDRVAVELFGEFVGLSRSVASITKDEARAFRTMLAEFPASRGKINRLASASIVEAIAIARRDELSLMSLKTQAKYLSILSPFFDWLVSDAPTPIQTNVFDGLHHQLERDDNRRPPFTTAQLKQIMTSPIFRKCAGDGQEHLPGDQEIRDWRYWIPLLCLFTGSRITEVAQLSVDDVGIKDEIPMVLLTHDEVKGQFVKNKRGRLAALHGVLVEAGFLSFWQKQLERAARDGQKQLFPELVAGTRGLLGDRPSRWFRDYLTDLGVKRGRDGYGAHSFRHTMTDAMRNAGYMDIEFGQLVLGHSNNTITAAYGSVPQGTPTHLSAMIHSAFKAEPFKKLDFAALLHLRRCDPMGT